MRYRVVQKDEEGDNDEPDLETQPGDIFVCEVRYAIYATDENDRNICKVSAHTFGEDKLEFQRIVH